jgi:hypothetical protein
VAPAYGSDGDAPEFTCSRHDVQALIDQRREMGKSLALREGTTRVMREGLIDLFRRCDGQSDVARALVTNILNDVDSLEREGRVTSARASNAPAPSREELVDAIAELISAGVPGRSMGPARSVVDMLLGRPEFLARLALTDAPDGLAATANDETVVPAAGAKQVEGLVADLTFALRFAHNKVGLGAALLPENKAAVSRTLKHAGIQSVLDVAAESSLAWRMDSRND